MCLFEPGYVLEAANANFVICFKCGDVEFQQQNSPTGEVHSIRPEQEGTLRKTIERLLH